MRRDASRSVRILIVAAASAMAATLPVAAQSGRVVRGVVLDTDNKPVPAVTIELAGGRPVVTDDSGRFRLQVSHRERISFDVHRVGFMPSRFGLQPGGDTTVSVTMLPAPRALPTVDVTARETDKSLDITGFNQRLLDKQHGTNTGYFITGAEIDRRHPTRISTVFEDLPGVTVCRTDNFTTCGLIGNHLVSGMVPGHPNLLTYCRITVYVDGHRLNSLASSSTDADIDGYVLPADVAGIEYYASGNRIPEKYSLLNGSCGLVLVWTRRGG